MKAKLITLPFHWVHPFADAKYLGCRAALAVYDPDAPEIGNRQIKTTRVRIFNAAVDSVRGKKYCGPKLPKTVCIPTVLRHRSLTNRTYLSSILVERLGFRRFKVEDLVTTPFAKCPTEAVPMKTLKKLEEITAVQNTY